MNRAKDSEDRILRQLESMAKEKAEKELTEEVAEKDEPTIEIENEKEKVEV